MVGGLPWINHGKSSCLARWRWFDLHQIQFSGLKTFKNHPTNVSARQPQAGLISLGPIWAHLQSGLVEDHQRSTWKNGPLITSEVVNTMDEHREISWKFTKCRSCSLGSCVFFIYLWNLSLLVCKRGWIVRKSALIPMKKMLKNWKVSPSPIFSYLLKPRNKDSCHNPKNCWRNSYFD